MNDRTPIFTVRHKSDPTAPAMEIWAHGEIKGFPEEYSLILNSIPHYVLCEIRSARNAQINSSTKEIEQALDRLKCAQTPEEIKKAVAIAEMVKLLVEESNAATSR